MAENAPSLWAYMEVNRTHLTSPFYCKGPKEVHSTNRIMDTPIYSLLRRVTLWSDLWLRWSPKASYPYEVYGMASEYGCYQGESLDPAVVDRYLPWVPTNDALWEGLYNEALHEAERWKAIALQHEQVIEANGSTATCEGGREFQPQQLTNLELTGKGDFVIEGEESESEENEEEEEEEEEEISMRLTSEVVLEDAQNFN